MAPRKKVGYTVVVFDSNSSVEYKEKAIEVYRKINELKFIESSKDETKIYLANTLNRKYPAKKAFQASEMAFFHPTNYKKLCGVEGTKGNLLEGIEMAIEDIESFNDGTYNAFQLVVFSDFTTEHDYTDNDMENLIKRISAKLVDLNAYVYFFGLDFEVKGLLDSKLSIYNYFHDCKYDSNLVIPSKICRKSYGVICPFDLAVDLYFSFSRNDRGYPFLEPLDINGLKLQTSCVKYLDKAKLKRPKATNQEPDDKKFVLADQQDEEVDFADVKHGLALHEKFVFIPQDVNKAIKNYPKFFKLLGFTDAKNVPEHYLLESTNLVAANLSRDAHGYVNYLIAAAEKHNKIGIALKAHMKGCRPKLFALIPFTNPHYFVMKELPYAEDFQILYNESDPINVKIDPDENDEIKPEQQEMEEKLFDFLDSINVDDKLVLHPNLRIKDGTKRQASLLGKKCFGNEIAHEEEEILGLRFNDEVVLEKLANVPVTSTALKETDEMEQDDDDPW